MMAGSARNLWLAEESDRVIAQDMAVASCRFYVDVAWLVVICVDMTLLW